MKDRFSVGEELTLKFKVAKVTESGVFIYPVGSEAAGQWFTKQELKDAREDKDA